MSDSAVGSTAARQEKHEEFSLREVLTIARKRFRLVVSLILLVVVSTALYTWHKAPLYESTATLRIDGKKSELSLLRELAPLGGHGDGPLETEMVVLRSRSVAETVVEANGLHVELASPRRPRSEVLASVQAPADAMPGDYRLELQSDGSYRAFRKRAGVEPDPQLRIRPGEPFRLDNLVMVLNPEIRADPPSEVRLRVRPFRRTVERFQKDLSVTRPDLKADVVMIRYRHTDPALAAVVPNAVTSTFLSYKAETTKSESSSTVRFLRDQVGAYEAELQDAETRLRNYREQAQVVSLTAEATEQIKRLTELRAQREQLDTERSSLRALLADAGRAAAESGTPSAYRQLAAFPTFLSNRGLQDVLLSLNELENQRSELMIRRTSSNADVQGLNGRIAELERYLEQTARSYLVSLDRQISSIDASLARFGVLMEAVPAREIETARLIRQQKLLEEIFTLLQTRLKEAEIQVAIEPGDVRVIDSALPADRPVAPRPMLNLALALLGGLLLGLTTAVVGTTLDTKVRSKEDALLATAGLPVLGMIPRIRNRAVHVNGNGNGHHNGKPWFKLGTRGVVPVPRDVSMDQRLVTHRDPRSPVSEAYRALRTNITFANLEQPARVLVVTSAMPGDGKTTSSANLAITLAQQGTRVLLIDADLRRGVLHTVFGVGQQPGLTHVLHGSATLDEAIREIDVEAAEQPLFLLSSGLLPPNPAEVLGSARMRALLEELRTRFDMIILDAPPLNLVTDAALLGQSADATVIVTRVGTTDRAALQHAATQLRQLRTRVSGVVLNDVDMDGMTYYGYQSYESVPAGK